MNIKQTLIEAFIILLCVLGGLYIYHNLIDKQPQSVSPVLQQKNDSLQTEINNRDVRIGVLNYRDSMLQADHKNKINELKNIQPKFTQKISSIKNMTSSQIDMEYRYEVNQQNSEIGGTK